MHRGLEQACSSGSPAVTASMLHALRDVAALYAALPPAVQKRELQVCLSPLKVCRARLPLRAGLLATGQLPLVV